MILRVKFRKYGPIRFIGHLDVMRFFQKAVRRADIDVAYSGGYSPHQIMSFASPLGVGLESNGEYMDIEVHSLTSCEDVKRRLNEASVPGIEIVSVKVLPRDAGNAMASVAAASYTVRFRAGREPDFLQQASLKQDLQEKICLSSEKNMADAVDAFLSNEHIWYTKETKKGVREIDLKPGIYKLTWTENKFFMLVDASSAGNIKPGQILEALLREHGESLKENALLITREETFTDIGSEGTRNLVPLDDIGFLSEEA